MLPDLSVAWVIFFVLFLTVLLDRLLFRPILKVMKQREAAIRSARELAERSATEARLASAEFEQKTAAARSEIYRQMDDRRRQAMERRAALLLETRRQAEARIAEATAQLRDQAAAARARLDRDVDALAASIVERVLGRRAS